MACLNQVEGCDLDSVNTFAGVLPCHHNELGCHNESQARRKILSNMKKVLNNLENLPKCEEWDTSKNFKNTRGPNPIGEYDRTQGKPWDLDRVPSRELIGGILIPTCLCMKKNGLQDECQRTQCRGRPWCSTEPMPDCPPFTKVPKVWVEPDPLLVCPNYTPQPQPHKN